MQDQQRQQAERVVDSAEADGTCQADCTRQDTDSRREERSNRTPKVVAEALAGEIDGTLVIVPDWNLMGRSRST